LHSLPLSLSLKSRAGAKSFPCVSQGNERECNARFRMHPAMVMDCVCMFALRRSAFLDRLFLYVCEHKKLPAVREGKMQVDAEANRTRDADETARRAQIFESVLSDIVRR
jgi:hypothetical protein